MNSSLLSTNRINTNLSTGNSTKTENTEESSAFKEMLQKAVTSSTAPKVEPVAPIASTQLMYNENPAFALQYAMSGSIYLSDIRRAIGSKGK